MGTKSRLKRERRQLKNFHERLEWVDPPEGVGEDCEVVSILRDKITLQVIAVSTCRELKKKELIKVIRETTRAWAKERTEPASLMH